MVIVTTAHQNASGIDLNKEFSDPASAKYTALENRTTPATQPEKPGQPRGGGTGAGRGDGTPRARGSPHVAVAHGCHGDHGPPEAVRDGREAGVVVANLGEIDGAGEQYHTCGKSRREICRLQQVAGSALQAPAGRGRAVSNCRTHRPSSLNQCLV